MVDKVNTSSKQGVRSTKQPSHHGVEIVYTSVQLIFHSAICSMSIHTDSTRNSIHHAGILALNVLFNRVMF